MIRLGLALGGGGWLLYTAGATKIGGWSIVLGVLILFVRFGGAARAKTAAPGMVRIHTHGGHGTRFAATHEAGHHRAARALGVPTGRVVINKDGSGFTEVDLSKASPEVAIAVTIAGRVAAGSQRGCGGSLWPDKYSDNWWIERHLDEVSPDRRARTLRKGAAMAESKVGGWIFDGGVGEVRDRLLRDGEIR